MKTQIITPLLLSAAMLSTQAFASGNDDPLITMVTIDQLEKRDASEGKPLVWEMQAWAGYDFKKVMLKTKGERLNDTTESAELQLLYTQAIAPYWDLQAGVRHDVDPDPSQNWAVIGVQGVAPYFIETDASLFIGESGQTGFRLGAEYELMLTQRWVLSPEIELNLYGKNDEIRGIGSGISDMEAGLRLRYEISRELAPYIGINWEKKFGNTADFARDENEEINDTQLVIGVRAWF